MPRLGSLETAVMDVLWASPTPMTVREVLDGLPASRALAYTTVMTVLGNLHRKGMAHRSTAGRAYHYAATSSREAVAAASLREILDATDNPQGVLLHFASTATDEESDALRTALDRRGPTP